jgi:hypothetical protein
MVFLSFSWFKFPYLDDYSLLTAWQLTSIFCVHCAERMEVFVAGEK